MKHENKYIESRKNSLQKTFFSTESQYTMCIARRECSTDLFILFLFFVFRKFNLYEYSFMGLIIDFIPRNTI
jgi:hypothetical protein